MVAMLTALLRTKDWNYLKRGCISILSVIVCVVISIIPEIFYRIVHGGTGLEGRIRSIADSETYCLKIIQLLLPVNGGPGREQGTDSFHVQFLLFAWFQENHTPSTKWKVKHLL